jgi:glutaredoxin
VIVVELYTRVGCHLCDDAKDVLERVRQARPFELHVIDVDTAEDLRERFGQEVPVVFVGGRKAFKYRVDEAELGRRLDRAAGAVS